MQQSTFSLLANLSIIIPKADASNRALLDTDPPISVIIFVIDCLAWKKKKQKVKNYDCKLIIVNMWIIRTASVKPESMKTGLEGGVITN